MSLPKQEGTSQIAWDRDGVGNGPSCGLDQSRSSLTLVTGSFQPLSREKRAWVAGCTHVYTFSIVFNS